MFVPDQMIDEFDANKLREEGQNLADRYFLVNFSLCTYFLTNQVH